MDRNFWIGLEISCGLMMLVLFASFPFLEAGSATYVVWFLAAGHLVIAMSIIGAFIYYDWDPFDVFF